MGQNDAVLPVCFEKKEARASAASSSSSCRASFRIFVEHLACESDPDDPDDPSSKRSHMGASRLFHGFQGVVRPRRPHCGSAPAYIRNDLS
ncbi:hypothetical protein ACFX1T_003248 [Malus domestica]